MPFLPELSSLSRPFGIARRNAQTLPGLCEARKRPSFSTALIHSSRQVDRRVLGILGTRSFGDLLIDLEEDRAAKAVVWGLLRDIERR
jgi:hypothetical protein